MRKLVRKIIPYSIRNRIVNGNVGKKVNIYKMNPSKLNIIPKKVSVIIPNYNYEKFIEERIDSVVKQTYPIYELIILDDCSTDNSVNKIKKIIKKYNNINIKLEINKKNSGSVFSQWQKGFNEAKGDYIWIAEADDSCNPKFLENVMKGFDNEDVVISYSESMRIDENNCIISTSCRDWMIGVSETRWKKSYINSSEKEITEALSICNTIPNVSAVVFKKKNQTYFLFTSYLKDGEYSLELYISKHLKGPYVLHPASPVCRGNKFGRCAGSLIDVEGKLYRPTQDCVCDYGEQIHIMEIDELSPNNYQEHILKENILPQGEKFYREGGHHINFAQFKGQIVIATDARYSTSFFLERCRIKVLKLLGIKQSKPY